MTSFRIGLLGAGAVGAHHVRAAAGAGGYAIAAICDVRREAAEALAAPGVEVYDDYRTMITEANLDGVIITTPHALHAQQVVQAAEAGLHVLVEKPMATTVEDCSRMIEVCRDADVLLAVAHVIHFDPVARETRALIASGEFGDPLLIAHRRSAHYEPNSRPAWFFDPILAGGGIVLNVGTHGLDRIQWFGGGTVRRVSSVVRGREGIDVETDSLALIELANGVTASVVLTSRGTPYYDETDVVMPEVTLRVSASDGLLLLRDGNITTLVEASPSHLRTAFRSQLDGFVSAARGDGGEYIDGAYGRSVVSAALAVYQAADRGNPVDVPRPAVRP
ncbi:Gfo/Idh/MocA family oxidoreductase [Lentzea sp. BCCO 10_0061]|uniref:Gfo/Idh/MocA family oxidoreductase n=1 Tax=Lentzea sokolovensis TaxID=3095429 RepID=A0ABU4V6S5_9PSEU|nr:Gfo/Idh/MocA family oxidoreductase [Lentzea sp. BCCO 10_0061]MDX8147444.1 Gfo/Idh/MocA family oxidoreductase [Lentzea sp. BCCO 10_0061]